MGISKITRNWQVTLPKDVREIKDLKENDSVIFAIEGNRVEIVKMNKDIIKATAGLWTDSKEIGIKYERKIRKGWSKRLKREFV
ncbi:AbrB/MazE/SpoVT family DNA-binding domain-containing protein [Candidatus Woesearchaeota archaeon]|nr:AbrB/MazE/SpoVT family DNA-binding domain-containing protein [Candidatus Woesearchaeota archaeon]